MIPSEGRLRGSRDNFQLKTPLYKWWKISLCHSFACGSVYVYVFYHEKYISSITHSSVYSHTYSPWKTSSSTIIVFKNCTMEKLKCPCYYQYD